MASIAWFGSKGLARYEQELVRPLHADLLEVGAGSFLVAAHQFCAVYENLPPQQQTGDPLQDLAKVAVEEDAIRYLAFDGAGAPVGARSSGSDLNALLPPELLADFFEDAQRGGARELTVDNFQAVLEGNPGPPAIVHLHAYPEKNLLLGMGQTQPGSEVRLNAMSDAAAAAFDRLARLGSVVYILLALAALFAAWLVLQYMFFHPLKRTFVHDSDDADARELTWNQFREYASQLQKATAEMLQTRGKLEREVEMRFEAEEERDQLRNTMAVARNKLETELRERYARDLQEAQSELMRREARVLHRHLAAPLEAAQKQLSESGEESLQQLLDGCLATVRGLVEAEHDLPHAPRRIALQPWLEQVVSEFGAEKGIAIQSDIRNCVQVNVDAASLRHAIEYVLDNAFRVTPEGARVEVNTASTEGHVEIRVVDHGSGIDPGARPHILVPFYSLSENANGLGLAITKSVVRQHGGRLELRSETDKGTAVIITLPIAGP